MQRWVAAALLVVGCSFDATGRGEDGSTDGDDGGTEDGGGIDDGADDDGGTGPGDDGGDDGDPTAPGDCPQPFREVLRVDPSRVVPPMQVAMDPAEGMVAFSEVEAQGSVSFAFQVPCPGTYHVWGRVLDQSPGTGMFDPDSFNVGVDGDAGSDWFYGCRTSDIPAGWSWQRVHGGMAGGQCEDVVDLQATLAPGPHEIVVRNREEAWFDQHAAIARILVTNDPNMGPGPGD